MHRDMTKITHWNQMESSIYYFIKRATWFCTQGEERERENPIQSSGSSLSIFSIELASVHTPSSFYVSCLRCAGELIGLAPRRGGEDRVRGPLLSPFCPVRTLRMHASLMRWSMPMGGCRGRTRHRARSQAGFVRSSVADADAAAASPAVVVVVMITTTKHARERTQTQLAHREVLLLRSQTGARRDRYILPPFLFICR
jgi:hypothetical protein